MSPSSGVQYSKDNFPTWTQLKAIHFSTHSHLVIVTSGGEGAPGLPRSCGGAGARTLSNILGERGAGGLPHYYGPQEAPFSPGQVQAAKGLLKHLRDNAVRPFIGADSTEDMAGLQLLERSLRNVLVPQDQPRDADATDILLRGNPVLLSWMHQWNCKIGHACPEAQEEAFEQLLQQTFPSTPWYEIYRKQSGAPLEDKRHTISHPEDGSMVATASRLPLYTWSQSSLVCIDCGRFIMLLM